MEACDVCGLWKSGQQAHRQKQTFDIGRPFQLVSIDLVLLMSPLALGGFLYARKIVDHRTKWKYIFFNNANRDAITALQLFDQSL